MMLMQVLTPGDPSNDETQRAKSDQRQDRKGDEVATTSHVSVEIDGGVIITASITNEAVADLGLKEGDEAWAVIKASDVMIGK
jgi:molybdopterin-binding protein